MGVIKRQGIKQSLVVYGGTVLGMANVLYFYPKFLSPDELGLVRFIIETSMLFAPFLLFGASNVAVKFFPEYKDKASAHNGFLGFLLLYTLAGLLLGFVLYLLFREQIYGYYESRDPLFKEYFFAVWWCVLVLAMGSLIKKYSVNFKRIVVPTLFHDYTLKLGVPLMAAFYFFEIIGLDILIWGLIGLFLLDLLLQLAYLKGLGEFRFGKIGHFFQKKKIKPILDYGLFGLMSGLGSRMITYLDSFMVGTLYSLEGLAVFYIAFVIAHVMTVPSRAINNISSPIISDAWHRGDTSEILNIYRKSSMVLMTSGFAIFILIWTNIDSLYSIMPKGDFYSAGKTVILFLAIAKMVDLTTAMNGQIINFSKYYRFNLYSLVVLAAGNIFLNILLIPTYGINGAAMATLISLTAFNLVKFAYVWYRFGMQPFSWNSLKMAVFGCFLLVGCSYLPDLGNPLLNIPIHSIFAGGLFLTVVWYSNWCPDINDLLKQVKKRLI